MSTHEHVIDTGVVDGAGDAPISDTTLGGLHQAGLAREYEVYGTGPVEVTDGTSPGPEIDHEPAPPRDGTRSDPGRARR